MGSPVLKSDKMRGQLARNVKAMLAALDWSENELARRSGVSQKQVNNITMQHTGCGIDALDAMAKVMLCEAWQLLSPDFPKMVDLPMRPARVLHAYVNAPRPKQESVEHLILNSSHR